MPSPNYAAYTRLASGQAISLGRARPQWEGPVTAYPNLDVSSLPEGSTRILCFNPLTFMTFGDMDYEEPDLDLKLTRWDNKTLQSRKIFIFDVEGYALRCARSMWHPEHDRTLKEYSIARVLKTSAEYETAHAQAEILYYIISKVGDKLDELAVSDTTTPVYHTSNLSHSILACQYVTWRGGRQLALPSNEESKTRLSSSDGLYGRTHGRTRRPKTSTRVRCSGACTTSATNVARPSRTSRGGWCFSPYTTGPATNSGRRPSSSASAAVHAGAEISGPSSLKTAHLGARREGRCAALHCLTTSSKAMTTTSTTPPRKNSSSTCRSRPIATWRSSFSTKEDPGPHLHRLSTRRPPSLHTTQSHQLKIATTSETSTISPALTPPLLTKRRRTTGLSGDKSPRLSPLSSQLGTAHGTLWNTMRTGISLTSRVHTTTIPSMYLTQTRNVGGWPPRPVSTMGGRYVSATCGQHNGLMSLAYCTCISYHRHDLEYHTLCREGLNIYYTAFDLTWPLWVHDRK